MAVTKASFLQKIKEYQTDRRADYKNIAHIPKKHAPPSIHRLSLNEDDRRQEFQDLDKGDKDKMPHHPAEEHATGDITDKVAKESSDSTASTHEHHQVDTGATSGGSLGAQAHKANPSPVMAEDIGKPASKEELKKRAEELNK